LIKSRRDAAARPPRERPTDLSGWCASVSQNNAWVIVDGVVYDVTGWIEEHPGGPDLLAKRAGQDVTETFRFLRVGFRA
jgi:predicted heme/steroid binding protein